MKNNRLGLLLMLAVTVACGGCQSMRESVKAQIVRSPSERLVDGDKARVFKTAGETLLALGYVIDRASASDGLYEARSVVRNDPNYRNAGQLMWRVRIEEVLAGRMRVQVEVRQIDEDQGGKGNVPMKTERFLPESTLQRHFFDELEQRLK